LAAQPGNLFRFAGLRFVTVTFADAADTLGGDFLADVELLLLVFFRVERLLDEDELAVAAVFLVQLENCLACCAAAASGVKNDVIFITTDLDEFLNKRNRLRKLKDHFVFKNL